MAKEGQPAPHKGFPRPQLHFEQAQEGRIQAYSYAVMDAQSLQVYACRKALVHLEVASLTKVMTCVTVLALLRQLGLEMALERQVISAASERTAGTTAEVACGEVYSIEQLLYALMLPSGNDAAVALAEWGGRQLLHGHPEDRDCERAFVREMNRLAAALQLRATHWANPHGLSCPHNKSTALDMARLCALAIRDPVFRAIVSARSYQAQVGTLSGEVYQVEWQNTNRLLRREGFFGVKTGSTASAGPCLASVFGNEQRQLVTVLLKTSKSSRRFSETRLILALTLAELSKRD